MNSEQSSDSSFDHSLDPVVPPLGDFQGFGSSQMAGHETSNNEQTGKLRADSNHLHSDQYAASTPSKQIHTGSQNKHNTAFVFRVECPGSPPQRLQLTGDLYTLGTADGCSIRLRDANVLPLHATLKHTPTSVTVEAHTHPVIVNGHAIKIASLQVGDTLSLGGYRFELISNRRIEETTLDRSSLTNALPPDLERAIASSTNRTVPQALPDVRESENVSQLVTQSRLEACSRREKLIEKREAKIENDLAELKFKEEDFSKRIARLEAEEAASLELYDQLSKRQSEITSLRQSLQVKQSLHLQRESDLQQAIGNLEKQFAEQKDEFKEQSEKTSIAENTIQELLTELDSIRKELTETQQERDLIELREQLQRREHEILVRQLETDRDRIIAEKAESQVQLSKMEDSVREIENLVSSANALDIPSCDEESESPASPNADSHNQDQANALSASSDAIANPSVFEPEKERVFGIVQSGDTKEEEQPLDRNSVAQGSSGDLQSTVNLNASDPALELLDNDSLREYADLSQKNSDLLAELIDLKRQRDKAKNELSQSVPIEKLSKLEAELASASSELARTRADYDEAISLLETMKNHRNKQENSQRTPSSSTHGKGHSSDDDPSIGVASGQPSTSKQTSPAISKTVHDRTRRSGLAGGSWKSLIKKIGDTPLKDNDGKVSFESESETVPSPLEDTKPEAEQSSSSEESDGWFQAKPIKSEKQTSKRVTPNPDKPASQFSGTHPSTCEDTLFVSKSQVAIPKKQSDDPSITASTDEVIWHGSSRESLKESKSKASGSPSESHLKTANRSSNIIAEDDVESQVDRILNRAEQNRTERTQVATTNPMSCDKVGNEAGISRVKESLTSRIMGAAQSLLLGSQESEQSPQEIEQGAFTRYAFALLAVIAGIICYRLVPGGVRYIALVMALLLAAIYANEGLSMTRSSVSR